MLHVTFLNAGGRKYFLVCGKEGEAGSWATEGDFLH